MWGEGHRTLASRTEPLRLSEVCAAALLESWSNIYLYLYFSFLNAPWLQTAEQSTATGTPPSWVRTASIALALVPVLVLVLVLVLARQAILIVPPKPCTVSGRNLCADGWMAQRVRLLASCIPYGLLTFPLKPDDAQVVDTRVAPATQAAVKAGRQEEVGVDDFEYYVHYIDCRCSCVLLACVSVRQ